MVVTLLLPVLFFIGVLFLVLHRLFLYLWDPKCLRSYPGLNAFCGLTNLAYIIEVRRANGFRTKYLEEAHKTRPIIRLGPNSLSFGDIRAIKDIYGHSTPCIKGEMYTTTAGHHRSLLDSIDKLEHSEKRKRLSAAFAAKNLEGWEHKVLDKCSRLIVQLDNFCLLNEGGVGHLSDNLNHTVDFTFWANLFTIEAIADIALSQHLGLLEAGNDIVAAEDGDGKIRSVSFIRSLHGIGRMAAPIVWSAGGYLGLKKILSLLSVTFRQEVANNNAYDDVIRHLVFKRARSGRNLDDFYANLVHDKQGMPTNIDLGEVAAEVNVFMNAGSDTTAIALTHVLYYLLKNPIKLCKLRDELDQRLNADEVVPSYASVRNIPYLRACLDESLRLSPPVSFGLQRKTPTEGTSILGEWIAGDTLVSVPAYVVHRDPKVFPDPDMFVPERWLKEESKEIQKYFIPFSAGSRGCIGRNISYLEQHMLMAALVKRYNFSLPDPDWKLKWEERFNLWPSAMPVKMWRR